MFGWPEHILVFRTANEPLIFGRELRATRDIRHCFEGGGATTAAIWVDEDLL